MRPEQTLLIACTGLEPEDFARDVIAAALAADPDWTSVVRMALEHAMTPALLSALDVDPSSVPSELLVALRQHCAALRDRSLQLVAELHAILESLERESIIAIAFKGPVLAQLLFADPGMRVPGDLDLLIRAGDVSHVCELLGVHGYVDAASLRSGVGLSPLQHKVYRRYQCEYQFVRLSDGLIVEPHWAFAQQMLAIDLDYEAMFERSRYMSVEGRPVRSLATEDLLLALCIHGGKHRWQRLAWIRDVAALLRHSPDFDLEIAIIRARSTGCARILLLGLSLAQCCAGVRLTAAVARLIDEDPIVQRLKGEVMNHLFDSVQPRVDNASVDAFRLWIRERWTDRMRYVCRTVLMPRREHIEMVTLPSSLVWAYYPLRWAHDYVGLPLWRLAKPAVRSHTN